MLNAALPPPQVIARTIPRCPCCNGRDYRYVSENTDAGFQLRDFSCEACGADILALYRRLPEGEVWNARGAARQFLLVVLAALMVFLVGLFGML